MRKLLCCLVLLVLLPLVPAEAADEQHLSDFCVGLTAGWTTKRDTYALSEESLTVTTLHGEADGAIIYIVAGLHGDEPAGWIAGNLLKGTDLKSGSVYIVSPANLFGAAHNRRTTESDRDINRAFPGDPEGTDAKRIAYAIYSDIALIKPDLVLDLHEANTHEGSRDDLRNSLIVQSTDGIGELVWDILLETESGKLCSEPFTLYSSPPSGSINRAVMQELGIPTITLETNQSEQSDIRIRNHLAIVQFIFSYYAMI